MQLATLVSFLTASLHWSNRWTYSINLHTWRSGGSVQSDGIFLLKSPKLSFPLLSSLGLMIVMLSLLDVLRCSARLIFKVPKSAHITPFLYDIHWLPISSRIQYKIALICFHIVSGTTPPFLSELLHLYSPSRSLRSAADIRIFRVRRKGRGTLRERSLRYIGPVLWNSLCQAFVFTLLSQNWKPSSAPLHTDLSFYQSITSNACVC